MAMDWKKFDKKVDLDGLEERIAEAAEHGDYPEIPVGKYEVSVVSMELGESKKKDPMLKIQFKVLDGEFESQLIFYNGVMQPTSEWLHLQIHNNNEMLGGLIDEDVKFKSFSQYAEEIEGIAEEVIEDEWEYILEKSVTKKGYDQYTIIEILD